MSFASQSFTCRQMRERLDAYAVGALNPRESLAATAHLNACPDCRARLDESRTLTRLVRNASVVAPPLGYLESLPARLFDRALRREAKRTRLRRAAWMASAVSAVVLIATARLVFVASPSRGGSDGPLLSFVAPSFEHPAPSATPRFRRADAKRGDVIEVDLMMVGPREVEGAPSEAVPLAEVPMSASESPLPDRERLARAEAWEDAPSVTRAATRAEQEALAHHPAGESVLLWTRSLDYRIPRERGDGLAFVYRPSMTVADVILPPEAAAIRAR